LKQRYDFPAHSNKKLKERMMQAKRFLIQDERLHDGMTCLPTGRQQDYGLMFTAYCHCLLPLLKR